VTALATNTTIVNQNVRGTTDGSQQAGASQIRCAKRSALCKCHSSSAEAHGPRNERYALSWRLRHQVRRSRSIPRHHLLFPLRFWLTIVVLVAKAVTARPSRMLVRAHPALHESVKSEKRALSDSRIAVRQSASDSNWDPEREFRREKHSSAARKMQGTRGLSRAGRPRLA